MDINITADEVRDYRTANCVGINEAKIALKKEKLQELLDEIIYDWGDEHFENKIITLAEILKYIITEEI